MNNVQLNHYTAAQDITTHVICVYVFVCANRDLVVSPTPPMPYAVTPSSKTFHTVPIQRMSAPLAVEICMHLVKYAVDQWRK